jgi:competence protein ComEC
MSDTALRLRLLILVLLTCAAVYLGALLYYVAQPATPPFLAVYYLDIGQGDATFIQTRGGAQVLIDGGPDDTVLTRLREVMPRGDTSIDLVVGTHPDKDHIAGLAPVLERYDVGTILTTENKNDTQASAMYDALKEKEGADVINARRGMLVALDASTTLRVLYPDADPTNMESNTSSIVLQLRYGSSTFLFTGDSPKNIEEYLVGLEGPMLRSDVLKVGHHGSRTSSSERFLDAVAPSFAVISAGKDNSYGHPHVEVTDMLFNKRVSTFLTAASGTIAFFSDGAKVWPQ